MADWLPQTWRSLPGTEVKAKPWSGGRVRSGAEILPRKWEKQRRLTEQKMIEGGTETDLETNLGRERERDIYNIVFIHCKRWYGKVFAIVRMDKFTLQGAPKEMPRKSMVTFAHCTRMPWGQWATRRGWAHTQQIKVWWRRMRKHNRRGFPMLLSANRSLQISNSFQNKHGPRSGLQTFNGLPCEFCVHEGGSPSRTTPGCQHCSLPKE